MRLSELQHKDIVNLDGKKIGNIIDAKINEAGQIESLIVENSKSFMRIKSKNEDSEVPWNKINKIVQDIILVDL
ncbi:MAG TPA: YlmC/YmxH family sporulation protein [Bacilli bacterium]|nr:YlmC/YmxH family sporulation protein [Bacilli bacterium]